MMLLKLVFSHQKTLSIGFIMRDTSDLASCIGLIGIVVVARSSSCACHYFYVDNYRFSCIYVNIGTAKRVFLLSEQYYT